MISFLLKQINFSLSRNNEDPDRQRIMYNIIDGNYSEEDFFARELVLPDEFQYPILSFKEGFCESDVDIHAIFLDSSFVFWEMSLKHPIYANGFQLEKSFQFPELGQLNDFCISVNNGIPSILLYSNGSIYHASLDNLGSLSKSDFATDCQLLYSRSYFPLGIEKNGCIYSFHIENRGGKHKEVISLLSEDFGMVKEINPSFSCTWSNEKTWYLLDNEDMLKCLFKVSGNEKASQSLGHSSIFCLNELSLFIHKGEYGYDANKTVFTVCYEDEDEVDLDLMKSSFLIDKPSKDSEITLFDVSLTFQREEAIYIFNIVWDHSLHFMYFFRKPEYGIDAYAGELYSQSVELNEELCYYLVPGYRNKTWRKHM